MGVTYKDSGVDIKAGDDFVDAIKTLVAKSGDNKQSIGSFGAVFDISSTGLKNPVLVTGTDGVGTKLKIAAKLGIHSTIGIDLVAMCVNDILCHGAKPTMFLDYYASGKLDPQISKQIITGIIEGCKLAGCSLSGGETAEMPGMYHGKDYDLAGFAIGFCEKEDLLPRQQNIQKGDILIALPSSGFHSNGFSLINKTLELANIDISTPQHREFGLQLLAATNIYIVEVLPLIRLKNLHALAHITGSGLYDNIVRVIPQGLDINIDFSAVKTPEIFRKIQNLGQIEETEMRKVFNMGIGFVLVVKKGTQDEFLKILPQSYIFGEVI